MSHHFRWDTFYGHLDVTERRIISPKHLALLSGSWWKAFTWNMNGILTIFTPHFLLIFSTVRRWRNYGSSTTIQPLLDALLWKRLVNDTCRNIDTSGVGEKEGERDSWRGHCGLEVWRFQLVIQMIWFKNYYLKSEKIILLKDLKCKNLKNPFEKFKLHQWSCPRKSHNSCVSRFPWNFPFKLLLWNISIIIHSGKFHAIKRITLRFFAFFKCLRRRTITTNNK